MRITAYNGDYQYLLTAGGAWSGAGGDLGGFYPGPGVTGVPVRP